MLLGTEIPCYSVAYASGNSLLLRCLCQRKVFDIPLLMPAENYLCLCQRKILPLHSFRQHKFLAPAPCLQKGNGVVLIYAVSVIWMLDNAPSMDFFANFESLK